MDFVFAFQNQNTVASEDLDETVLGWAISFGSRFDLEQRTVSQCPQEQVSIGVDGLSIELERLEVLGEI